MLPPRLVSERVEQRRPDTPQPPIEGFGRLRRMIPSLPVQPLQQLTFDAKGQYLGRFKAGRQSQNLAFSGPGKQTLYMTAREGLYRVRMLSKGPDRLGK